MKVQAESFVQRETAVGESRRQGPWESAFGACDESRGVVSLIVRFKAVNCSAICNLGGNTEAFSSHTPRGEKAFFGRLYPLPLACIKK